MSQTIINIDTPNTGGGDPLRHAFDLTNQMFTELYNNVVFKEAGKGLSSNDFDDDAQLKLEGIQEGAEVNVQANLNQNDDTQDNFVIGKEAFLNLGYSVLDGKTGTTPGFIAGQVDFILPSPESVCIDVAVNDGAYVPTTANNAYRTKRWSQTGDTVTIYTALILNAYIIIKYK